MTISLATTALSKPDTDAPISRGKLAYLRARYKGNIHSLVLEEFVKSRVKKATLARRLRMAPAQLTRLLATPSNLTLETLSDLLFAISGTEPQTVAREFGALDVDADNALAQVSAAAGGNVRVDVVPGRIEFDASNIRFNHLSWAAKPEPARKFGNSRARLELLEVA